MTTVTKQHAEELEDWEDPIDWGLVTERFTSNDIYPRLPRKGVDLRQIMPAKDRQGRSESWNEAEGRYKDWVRAEYGYDKQDPSQSINQEVRMMVGILALPRELTMGTAKRLFGESVEYPTVYQLLAVAHALFNPSFYFWGHQRWSEVLLQAEQRVDTIATLEELIERGA